jgi:hypothetical protein
VPTIRTDPGDPLILFAPDAKADLTVQWDTEGVPGRVRKRINGVLQPVDFASGTAGRKDDEIQLGDEHEYELVDPLRGNVLASAKVLCRRLFAPGPSDAGTLAEVDALLATAGDIQQIRKLSVVSGHDFLDLRFETTQPAVPWVQIGTAAAVFVPGLNRWEIDKSAVVAAPFPVLAGMSTRHTLTIDGLPPGKTLFYLLTADGSNPQRRVAQRRGSFQTAARDVKVTIERIFVHDDSDSGGNGEIFFGIQGFDPDGKTVLGGFTHGQLLGESSLHDKQDVPIHRSFVAREVGRTLTLLVHGQDDDTWDDLFPSWPGVFTGYFGPPGSGSGSTNTKDWSRVQHDFVFPRVPLGTGWSEAFELESPRAALHFTVYGSIEILPSPVPKWSDPPAPRLIPPQVFVEPRGRPAPLVRSGAVEWFAVAPGGAVVTTGRIRQRLRANSWARIGEGVTGATALGGPDDEMLLFGTNADGAVVHKSRRGGEWGPSGAEWRSLGGRGFRRRVLAARLDESAIVLFAVAADGSVHRSQLDPRRGPERELEWLSLGGNVRDHLQAVAREDGAELFALGREGEVLHASVGAHAHTSIETRWDSLGGRFEGPLIAHGDRAGPIELVAVDHERVVWRCRWVPGHSAAWKDVGGVDSLIEARPS